MNNTGKSWSGSQAKSIAKKYVQVVRESGVPVINAYLFGSYSKGNNHKDSDIDICIVSNAFSDDYIKEAVKLRSLAFNIDNRIEPIPFTELDMQNKYSSLASEISKYGINLL
ncbi:MAG: nucleotidyltransferase domain-containing protein [bacterium]|nr:nucleotidyltransferase domain-containing protein [bacterium]